MRAGRDIPIHGDGRQTRDFVYVGDVVRALVAAMEGMPASTGVLNVCTGRATSIMDLAEAIAGILGIRPRIVFGPPRAGETRVSVGSPAKARRLLGFEAQTRLADGLRATLDAPA